MSRGFNRRFVPRVARPKRLGAWEGGRFPGIALTANVAQPYVLWDTLSSEQLNAAGRLMHRVTYLEFVLNGGSFTASAAVAWYLYVFTTDELGDVPSASIFSPLDATAAVARKGLMDRGFLRLGAATLEFIQCHNWQRECKARRKFDDTDALLLVFESSVNIAAGGFDVNYRTYCSW